tara:strand:+ start:2547 stop:4949 length:2403 start_codon:yes stop_codon:yes gene_type:complete
MKNKLILYLSLFFYTSAFAENLLIESKNISINKKNEFTIFENDVFVKTVDNNIIKSDYAEYNKKNNSLIFKRNVIAEDNKKNLFQTSHAYYNEKTKIFKSFGPSKITTSENYVINGEDIIYDNFKNKISSDKKSIITDLDNNKIYLDNFEYNTQDNIFKSIGLVKINDSMGNSYEFSQIYIDTVKKEILGSDTKAFLNHDDLKFDKRNKPRVFSNLITLNNEKVKFNKSVFTMCSYRKNDKCPPWSIQASEMLHDRTSKTIYYDNAVIKVYDIPIFYIPKLSHPDPTVDRRSGFLPPSFSDSKNLGLGLTVPYFWAVSDDKNFTFTNKLFASENPLFLGQYHQAFKNSNFLTDFGYTEGYKKSTSKKLPGNKSHIFSKFVKNFKSSDNAENSLSISTQKVSNKKYLKLYKIESNLVDYKKDTLENSINYSREDDNLFFGFSASVFETLKNDYIDEYEYILPELTVDKNLFSNISLGNLDLQSSYKVHKYDTNKYTNFLINDFDWNYNDINFESGIKGKILGNLKNINYETKNVETYKNRTTNELFGALGFLTELTMQKNLAGSNHFLTPKTLFRYSPGSMRKDLNAFRLNPTKAFNLNRLENMNNYETGLSSTIGFDYKIKNDKNNSEFDFSIAQVINEKENKKMPTESSLDEKLSDLVGHTDFKLNDNVNLNYSFSLDQNYNDFNYNEFGTSLNYNKINFDFNYLQENKHIGNQEYFNTKIDYNKSQNSLISIETKRNLITNSAEFYNLSYEYLNDCLRAGLVYRREFYNDSELEPENSLMFKITLVPFGNINSPSFSR